MFVLGLGEKEIKIAIWARVLFCVVNLDISKFLWVVTDVKGVNRFMWEYHYEKKITKNIRPTDILVIYTIYSQIY